MIYTCYQCSQPATGRQDPINPGFNLCIGCAAVESLSIPITPERRDNVPDVIVNGPAWAITKDIQSDEKPDGSMWLHQAKALQELSEGRNVGNSDRHRLGGNPGSSNSGRSTSS